MHTKLTRHDPTFFSYDLIEDPPRRSIQTGQKSAPKDKEQGALFGQGDEPLWPQGRVDVLDRESVIFRRFEERDGDYKYSGELTRT
jgi:hypothetical protein